MPSLASLAPLVSLASVRRAALVPVLTHAVACAPVETGTAVLQLGAVAIEVPAPGLRVWSEVFFVDGTFEAVGVLVDDDGALVIDDEGALTVDGPGGGDGHAGFDAAHAHVQPADAAPCSDGARSLLGFHWEDRLDWWFNAGSSPLDAGAVEAALIEGTKNITRSRNGCGLADTVSATHAYRGRTTTPTQTRADGTCKKGDGKNVVGFGDLPVGVLGVACTYATADGVAVESDIRFNKVDHAWTTDPQPTCTRRFDIQSVMTHERGHTFGLGHVGEGDHAALTMSTRIEPCQKTERTLARGDVIGLRELY